MTTTLFRLAIGLTMMVHTGSMIASIWSACCFDGLLYSLFTSSSFITFLVQMTFLLGNFFLFKPARWGLLATILVALWFVFSHGDVILTGAQMLVVQIGCGLYGVALYLAFFCNDIRWRATAENTP